MLREQSGTFETSSQLVTQILSVTSKYVTAALTATPSSDLNAQVESYRDKQEGRMPCPLLATLTSSTSRGERD